jgi:hypothetical protein
VALTVPGVIPNKFPYFPCHEDSPAAPRSCGDVRRARPLGKTSCFPQPIRYDLIDAHRTDNGTANAVPFSFAEETTWITRNRLQR